LRAWAATNFVVVVEPSAGARAEAIAQGIVQSLGEPFSTDRGVAHLGASVGVVVAPDDGTTTEQLRESVDLALYRAKQEGRARVCFFNADMDAAARDRRKIAGDLQKAVTAGDISLAYQPLVSTQTGQITSVEALARWTHAMRGPIRPDVFVPIAEECGLIDTLGEQLLHQACRDALIWPEHIRVAVNLSPLQFLSGRLFETVSQALQASGLAPNRLQLEVTEGLVIRDVERTFRQLEELRALGIQILIDDFGAGYSSLSYFQRFPSTR
jgi:predicted signal transduction protein with EAL and GGDEF domain